MTIDGISYVGGLAILTSIDATSVKQRIVHVWENDRPGVKIEPEPIDWKAFCRARAD